VDDNEIDKARTRIGELARLILDDELSYIEGARSIWRLGTPGKLSERDADLAVFLAIDSETDALPVGAEFTLWNHEALEKLQPEIELAEAWAKKVGQTACENLVKRFGESSMPYETEIVTLCDRSGRRSLNSSAKVACVSFRRGCPSSRYFIQCSPKNTPLRLHATGMCQPAAPALSRASP